MSRRPPQNSAGHPLLPEAVALHQAGRVGEAAQIYERILAQMPRQFDAAHLLGVIALQEGRLDQAQRMLTSALKIKPNDAAALSNLGTAHLRNGQLEAARDCFQRALKLQPNSVNALSNLGTVLHQMGRFRDATTPLRRAYAADPKSVTVCNLLGACLLKTGDAHAAAALFDAATQAEPGDGDGWANLSVALNEMGEQARALECANKAVALRPRSSAALAALAAVLFEQGKVETAIETYREAVALPDPSAQTYCGFANALWTGGLNDEAAEQLRRAVAIDGDNASARWALAMMPIKSIYDTEAEIEVSRGVFSKSMADLQTWFQSARRMDAYTAVGTTQPFFLAYHPYNNKDLLSRYGKMCAEWMASMPSDAPTTQGKRTASLQRPPALGHKMRIGIASAHIRNHSVWNAIAKGWVRALDKAHFEIYLFQLGRTCDHETESARREVAHFEDKPEHLQGWIQAITSAKLDALIYPEIGMDALTTQLASLRLAPVQAASWGHPETTGLPTMDLYLSAEGLEPPGAGGNYSERLVCLPNMGVCVEPLSPSVTIPDLRSLGLPRNEPLLLCAGMPFKYSPLHDKVWVRIAKGLRTGRGGRLVFFRSHRESRNKLLEERLRRAFNQERVDFDAHVCLIPNLDRSRFFGLMQQSALMLDTLGFSGFNTALQAIECGLPVVAHEGEFMRGRLASGILRRMGLPELVATTDEDFIQMVIQLAEDASKRKELRLELAKRCEILFQDLEPVRALERCLTDEITKVRSE
jgi:protein O-GlcNAc transferase